ncbi:MAG: hypothetical protein K5739_07875 [Lachnospiraceae bacterium]|nr:hypothetical protein [Lachnospiraceae bacterium]
MKKNIAIVTLSLCLGLTACTAETGQGEGPGKDAGDPVVVEETAPAKEEETEGTAEDPGEDTETKEEAAKTEPGSKEDKIAANGVLFTIPTDYKISIDDETGNIYIDDKDLDFNLVMVVRDGSYEESLQDKDALTANARQQDVTILKDITEYTSGGKSYAYFTFAYNDESSTNTVIYTGATKDKRIGINMMINASDLKEEDVIDRINGFLQTAQATDLPDTTRDDLVTQEAAMDDISQPTGEVVDSASLKLGKSSVTVSVPEGYYYQDDQDVCEEDMFAIKYFQGSDADVTLSLYADGMYTDEEELAESECLINDNAKDIKDEKVQTLDHKGKKVTFKNVEYTYDGTVFHKAIAICRLSDKSMYAVYAQNLDGSALSFESLQGFLDFNE